MSKNFLKKFPKGTDLRGSDWDRLAIWGNHMAIVTRPMFDSFDPELMARLYLVALSDLMGFEKLRGVEINFRRPGESMYEQPFYFKEYPFPRTQVGQLQEPVEYWVAVSKFSDLSGGEDSDTQLMLDKKGYVDIRKYKLTKGKWGKLLTMSFPATQDLTDYEMSNAADEALGVFVAGGRAFGAQHHYDYTPGQEQAKWEQIPGVYTTTRQSRIRWIVSRKPSKKGL
jgi:hypothetical protein